MQTAKRRQRRGTTRTLFVATAVSLFGVLFFSVKRGRTAEFDHAITVSIQRRKAPWFDRLMRIVSWPGYPPESRIIPWLLPGALLLLGYPLEALFQLLGWGTGFISFSVKSAMRRPRPDHPAINVVAANIGGSSFPSGHVINYIGVYGFFLVLVKTHVRANWVRKPLMAVLGSLIGLVGISRIYLGHHWLTDVLASYLLGLSYLVGLTALYQAVKRLRAHE
ncbi:MAG: phosphatase PAP2 family protein [Thermomicrobiales bacterium]